MSFHSWLQNLRSAISPGRVHRHSQRWGSHRAATHRPTVEVLEDRCLLAYAVTNLGALDGFYRTKATDLNEAGQVVGYCHAYDRTRAFLWDNGTMIDLGTLGGISSGAYGINDRGQVVGYAALPNATHAFLITPQGGEWFRDDDLDGRNDLMIDLGTLPGPNSSFAEDINNAGQVIGKSGYNPGNAFFWDPASGMIDLGEVTATAINEVGQVTGQVTQFPFLWDPVNGMAILDPGPGYSGGGGEGINDAGEITGYLWTEDGKQVAFLWSGGYVQLEAPFDSGGADVNNSGQVVGKMVLDYGDDYDFYAVLWDATSGMVGLTDQLLPGSNPFLQSAQAINDSGAIVASTYNGNSSYLLTPIPPGTPSIRIDDAPAVTESNAGTRAATFTVTLSAASTETVTVAYATGDGTADAGSDYQAASGTLTIPAGQTTGTITVLVNGDRLAEPNETFTVNLSSPAGETIADGQGIGTIEDDEPRISISDVTKLEGKKGQKTLFTFTVTLSAAYDQPVTMSYRTVNGTATTAGGDYVAKSGTLTFAPGQTSKTITIEVKGDSKREANETFYLDLFGNSSNSRFTKNRGLGSILNDD